MPNRSSNPLINRLIGHIETVMYHHQGSTHKSFADKILWTFSLPYGGANQLRRNLYRRKKLRAKKLSVPVISVGNLAVGGTGKTPMAIYLAQLLQKAYFRPAIISRGYGGKAEKKGLIVSDGTAVLANSDQAGDEPVMMAQRLAGIPVIVGKNRFESGKLAIDKFNCNVILLDDGFQHLGLHRDLNIVLLDAQWPLGNGQIIPRGILREPFSAIADAHAVVFTRSPNHSRPPNSTRLAACLNRQAVYWAGQTPFMHGVGAEKIDDSTDLSLVRLRGKKVYLFSAIARNDDFYRTITELGAKIQGHSEFGDHHRYCQKELADIIAMAIHTKSEYLVTTEKDMARLETWPPLPLPIVVIGVEISFLNDTFDRYMLQSLKFQLK